MKNLKIFSWPGGIVLCRGLSPGGCKIGNNSGYCSSLPPWWPHTLLHLAPVSKCLMTTFLIVSFPQFLRALFLKAFLFLEQSTGTPCATYALYFILPPPHHLSWLDCHPSPSMKQCSVKEAVSVNLFRSVVDQK